MAIDVSLITEYTPEQIIAACKQARMTLLLGGQSMRMLDGRSIDRISAEDINIIEQAAYESLGTGADGGNVLVIRGNPQ